MALKGTLDTVSLVGVIQLLCEEDKTGRLRVKNGENEYQIIFLEGNIVYAVRPFKRDLLGELLIRDGLVGKEAIDQCLEGAKERKQALGKTLVEDGFISAQQLADYLYKQVEEVLYSLFFWKAGEFEYEDTEFNLAWIAVVNINTVQLIMNAAKRVDEAVCKVREQSGTVQSRVSAKK